MTAAPLQVMAGVLQVADRVLLARRAHPPELAGQWEFPGGKVEPGETPAVALARELQEELGIRVSVGAEVASVAGSSRAGGPLLLLAHRVHWLAGALRPTEHDAVAMVPLAQLASWPVLPLDQPVLAAVLESRPDARLGSRDGQDLA